MGIFVIVLGVFAVFLALRTIKIVPQQNAWVIERFGKYNRTLEPGLSIVIPFMDRVAYRHHLTEFPIDIAPAGLHHARQHPGAGRRGAVLPG